MFNDIKVGVKLVGSIAFICILAATMLLYGIKVRGDLLLRLDSVHRQYEVDIRELGDIKAGLEKMRGDVYRYLNVSAERNKMAQNVNDMVNSVNHSMQTYKNKKIGDEEKRIIAEFDAAWPEMQRGYKEIMKLAAEGKNDEVSRLMADGSYVVEARKKTMAAIYNLNQYSISKNEVSIKAGLENTLGVSVVMLALGGVGFIVAIALVIVLTVSITNPLKKGVLMMESLKKGHLSNRLGIKRKDEIGVLANAMDQFADHLQKNVIFNMQQISEGNINIEPAIIDDKDEIGPALKKMVETINNLVNEMKLLTKSAMEGKLGVRGNEEAFKGAYQEIVHGVNKTLDEVMGPINEASFH